MSPSIAAIIVVILTNALPLINVHIAGDALTQWVNVTIDVIGGIVVYLHSRYQTGEIVGHANVNLLGGVKKH